jgi:membrane-bound lytic murein transglycosylase D
VVYSGDAPKNFVTNTSNVKRTNVSQQHTKSADGFVYYTIERGDTLWSISKKFPGVAVDSIKQDNQIYNVHNLQPGMVLKIGVSSNG